MLLKSLDDIYQLWDEIGDVGCHKCDEALHRCMIRLCEWICADHSFWMGSVRTLKASDARRDPTSGWRNMRIQMMDRSLRIGNPTRHWDEVRLLLANKPEDANIALSTSAGQFRAHSLSSGSLVDIEAFQKSHHYKNSYRKLGICDRIWVAFPFSADAESIFCFDKLGPEQYFTTYDLELAALVLRGMRWLHRWLLMSHGLVGCKGPLTAAERRLCLSLLSGNSEKIIAQHHNLTPGTAHQYATRIYRKFGVHGRTDFMALWLCGRPENYY